MSDLISRQDALAKVRTRLQDWAAYGNEEYRRGLYACEDMILSLPSAEADCSTCKHKDKGWDSEECDSCCGNNNHYESAEAVQGWIPVSKRLPKKGEVVLITNRKCNVRCGQYRSEFDVRDGTHYWWWKGKTVESVLAWMPLPEPYREDGEA